MAVSTISFKNKPIRVQHNLSSPQNLKQLKNKLNELEFDFEFRKKLKKITSVELINDIAIFIYNDGTKLYLEVS